MSQPASSTITFLDNKSNLTFLADKKITLEDKAKTLYELFTTVGIKIEILHKNGQTQTWIANPDVFLNMPDLKEQFNHSLVGVLPYAIDYIIRNVKPEKDVE